MTRCGCRVEAVVATDGSDGDVIQRLQEVTGAAQACHPLCGAIGPAVPSIHVNLLSQSWHLSHA